MKQIIAIDPGASGAVAWNKDGVAGVASMPKTLGALKDMLASLVAESGGDVECHLEQVSGYCGGDGAPGSAMFNFGATYWYAQGVLAVLNVPVIMWTPQRWQKALNLGHSEKPPRLEPKAKGETEEAYKARKKPHNALKARMKTEWKTKLWNVAQQRFPQVEIIKDNADALLILAAAMEGK